MSLRRLIYYSAVIGGWAAFFGWLLAECTVLRGRKDFGLLPTVIAGGIVGAAVGAGLNLVAGLANATLRQLLHQVVRRVALGIAVGGIGGAMGIIVGQSLLFIGLPRALGFMVLGLGVGLAEGFSGSSKDRIRNGVIGGLLGGLVGGLLFDPISSTLESSTDIASRATAFVILGLCVGALIGLANFVLKRAWLTVLDGHGVGRQHVLDKGIIYLGRGDHLPMPFRGKQNSELESEHAKIAYESDGTYTVQDNNTRLGVTVRSADERENQSVSQPRRLKDGDVIKFGSNLVRFNERHKTATRDTQRPSPAGGTDPKPPDSTHRTKAPPAPPPTKATKPSQPSESSRPLVAQQHSATNEDTRRKLGAKLPPPPPPPKKKG